MNSVLFTCALTREAYAVIYGANPPRDAISALMSRPYKEEG